MKGTPPLGVFQRALTLEIDVEALGADDATEPRIPISISSETPYERWFGVEILGHASEEIDLSYAAEGLPFCLDHDTREQLGIVEDVALGADRRLRGFVRFGNHPDAPWIKQDMLAGVRKNISVGYRVLQMRLEAEDETGATYRVTRWLPMEVSSVAVPADITVGAGRAADEDSRTWFRSVLGEKENVVKNGATSPAAGTEPTTVDAAISAERQRSADIQLLCADHGATKEETAEFLKSDASVAEVGLALLQKKRTQAPTVFSRSPEGPINRNGDVKEEWDSMGEFLQAVRSAAPEGGRRPDPRLVLERGIASGQSVGVPADGGFAVPIQQVVDLTQELYQKGALLSRVNRIPSTTGKLEVIRSDETSRADGSRAGGVRAYWAAEADTVAASRMKVRKVAFDAHKLIAIGYATEELLEDAVALAAEMQMAFNEEMLFKAEDAILNGTGNGQPLGILNSPVFVTEAVEGGQTIANTPANVAKNVANMKSRLFASSLSRYVWLMNQEFEPSLLTATLGGSAAAVPIYLGPNGLSSSPYGTILGREAIPIEYSPAVGTVGDFIAADLSQYDLVEVGGVKSLSSVHVRFLYDEQAFRFTYRLDGKPRHAAPVTPYKGSKTRSPFVGLAARS